MMPTPISEHSRENAQPRNMILGCGRQQYDRRAKTERLAPACPLEVLGCLHCHRVAHLWMEAQARFRRRQPVGRSWGWRIEIKRDVGATAAVIDVDDLDALPDRAWREFGLLQSLNCYAAQSGELVPSGEGGDRRKGLADERALGASSRRCLSVNGLTTA